MRASARFLTAAEMQGRDLSRRRLAIGILVGLPVAFYLSEVGTSGVLAVASGAVAIGWALSGVALFAALGSRHVDPRLVLMGYRPMDLLLGRLLVLLVLGMGLVALSSTLMLAISHPPRPGLLVLAVTLTAFIAVPLGLAVAALVSRELEGTLVLIGVVGIQLSLSVYSQAAQFLPLYGASKLAHIVAGERGSVIAPLVHGVISALVLLLLALLVWSRRVRVQRPGPVLPSRAEGVRG